ncbi:MBL fold metallo-hydrolase [Halomonas sp. 3H]|jgi:glyoxylase-like metal-dependent hydrolase (beta-lactamase superfamily II)|uniref:MBL fold metallo-hydrolase n=1 Tax=Halomonas TaxID=2745 RepID=UPI0020B767F0|nr:MBL fold metallo-hydrolase [Halomonas sp. 3H]
MKVMAPKMLVPGPVPAVGALALTLASLSLAVQAAPPDQRREQVPGWFRMMVDRHEVTALYDGYIDLDTGLLTGMDQEALRTHLDALFIDTESGVQTAVNAFLVHTGDHLVLVDAGSAACFGPTLGQVEANLRASGYAPEEVDTLLMTHLHPDHVCGLVDGEGRPVYPNAELRTSRGDADFWLSESRAEAVPEEERAFFDMARNAVAPYREAGRFSTFEPGDELLPGIQARDTHGHTPGHASFLFEGEDDEILVWGDVVHSYGVQFDDPSVAIEFDTDPEQAIATRQAVLEGAAEDAHWVAGAHLPFPGIGHVIREGEGYRWLPVEFGPIREDR